MYAQQTTYMSAWAASIENYNLPSLSETNEAVNKFKQSYSSADVQSTAATGQ